VAVVLTDGPEEPLLGGDVTEGLVRIGDTVRRPRSAGADLVEAVLRFLEHAGFDGAPRFLGIDDQGRQALSFVPGEVAGRPWPDWMADDDRIASVARLVRRLDDAMHPFGLSADLAPDELPDPPGMPPSIAGPPRFVGHMDITPENVVFVDGRARALIDFDLARPTDRVGEVCNLLLWWAPLMAVVDRDPAVRDVDAVARAALLVDEYGLGADDRHQIVPVARNTADRAWFSMRNRAARLGGGWQRMWEDGAGDRILRRQHWLAEHADELGEALTKRRGKHR
jgi:Phosphotransferase enzyme family